MGWLTYEDVRLHSRLDLGDKARLLLLEMALVASDETRIAHPGTARLMETSRASRATVFRTLKRICSTPEVEQIQRGGGSGNAAEYRIADLADLYGERLIQDETQKGLTQDATQTDTESVSPRRDAKGSHLGLTRVSPTRARVTALQVNDAPQPPKRGARQREIASFNEQLTEWVTQHLPELEANSDQTLRAVKQALGAEQHTRDEVRSFIKQWWPQLLATQAQHAREDESSSRSCDTLRVRLRGLAALPEDVAEAEWRRLEAEVAS